MKPSPIPRQLCRRSSVLSPSRTLPISRNHLRPQPQWTTRTTTPTSTPTPLQPTLTPRRTFLSSFLPSSGSNNNNNGNNGNNRTLTATRTLPYPPEGLYKVIASVESYSSFLPFLTASTVTARSPESNYPTRAFLTVGYGPLSETFTSRVDCDRENWVVEARSGAKFGVDSKMGQEGLEFPGANEGIFEYLSTRWELVPAPDGKTTKVDLEIQFEFRNQFHAMMMSTVEGQMAGVMIEAFEKRIHEMAGNPQ